MFDTAPTPKSWKFASDNDFDIVVEMGDWIPDLDALLATRLMHPGHTYNHCSNLSSDQWDRISDSGAAINMVPRSDSHYGFGGFIPVLEADRRAIQVGISSDNELNYGYDLFTEMRMLQTIQRGLSFQAEFADETDVPPRYGARDALRAATVGGSINTGMADRTGTLTPGKKADIVVLDLDQVTTKLYGSILGTVVNFAGPSNVDAVFVDGVARKWPGQLAGTDYATLVDRAVESRGTLLAQYGTDLETVRWSTNIPTAQAD